jgi:hypothetical protein
MLPKQHVEHVTMRPLMVYVWYVHDASAGAAWSRTTTARAARDRTNRVR